MADHLKQLIRDLALEVKPEGEFFTLKSGAQSRYYLDLRNLTLNPHGLNAVVNRFMVELKKLTSFGVTYTAVGGPSVGADPIIGGLVYAMGFAPRAGMRGFLVRPEAKEHGKGGRIVGPLTPHDRCVIFEDVTTTGGSALDAIAAVEDFGAKVVHVYSVVDRLGGGAEAFAAKEIPFTTLFTIKDFGLE